MKRWACVFVLTVAVAGGVGFWSVPGTAAEVKGGLTFEIYKDARAEFRWRLKAANGKEIATSGEGYKKKEDCKHGIEIIQTGAATAKVEEKTEK